MCSINLASGLPLLMVGISVLLLGAVVMLYVTYRWERKLKNNR